MNATLKNSSFITCYVLGHNGKTKLIKDFSTRRDRVIYIITLTICICLLLSTVILNALTVLTIRTSPLLRKKVCYFAVMLQSVIDLAIGLILFPTVIVLLVHEMTGFLDCILLDIITMMGCLLYLYSVTALSVLNIERYLGVLYPLFHKAKVTKKRISKSFALTSLAHTVIILIVNLSFSKVGRYYIGGNTVFLIVMTVFVYIRIYCCGARKVPSRVTAENTPKTTGIQHRLKEQLKLAKACFVVVLYFI